MLDLSQESEATQKLYGIGDGPTDNFGRQCLLARRLAEAGVRYIQVSTGYTWDQHGGLKKGHEQNCLQTDRPTAGLLLDLKTRGLLDESAMETKARETLDGLSVRTLKSVRTPVASLSGGQRQTVAIARAVLWNSRIVILDEPTAALGVAQTEQVLALVRRLADQGLAVILISHNLVDVFQVADRIAALYLGRLAAEVSAKDVRQPQVVELITTGRTEGVESELPTSVDEGVTA